MPIPLIAGAIGAVMTARNGYILAGIYAVFKDEIVAAVEHIFAGDGVAGYITDKVNQKLSAHGLDLAFSNVFDKDRSLADVDAFAARRVNAKAGTNFATLKGIDRDAFLVEVSKVLAARMNAETGSNVTALWPVATLRREMATELARQYQPGVDLATGAMFPQAKLLKVQEAVASKLGFLSPSPVVAAGGSGTFWGPPRDAQHALVRAKGRARSEKYRRTHRQAWVAK